MQKKEFLKAGILTLVLTIAVVGSYELWLRHHGYSISYDDDERLWADKRSQVYESPDKAVVFIGSSRIKFDLDIATWKKETGLNAIQLAMVGSTPLPLLHDLAEDKNFKGKLIVDVTEILFLNNAKTFLQRPSKGITYYHKNTPSGKAGFGISYLLESTSVKADVDKIKARGGQVLFVRTPSSGPFWMGEQQGFPREKYWNKILEATNCAGVYFKDYKVIANFQCPEFSHLSPSDAAVFTKNLVQILEKDKGWQFPNKNSL